MSDQNKNPSNPDISVSVYMDAEELEESIEKMESESGYRPFKQHGPSTGSELGVSGDTEGDAAIACEVKTILGARHYLAVKNLRISVHNGEVTLAGSVYNYDTLQQILALTERIEDVKSVVNYITVETASPSDTNLPEVRAPNTQSDKIANVKERENSPQHTG